MSETDPVARARALLARWQSFTKDTPAAEREIVGDAGVLCASALADEVERLREQMAYYASVYSCSGDRAEDIRLAVEAALRKRGDS